MKVRLRQDETLTPTHSRRMKLVLCSGISDSTQSLFLFHLMARQPIFRKTSSKHPNQNFRFCLPLSGAIVGSAYSREHPRHIKTLAPQEQNHSPLCGYFLLASRRNLLQSRRKRLAKKPAETSRRTAGDWVKSVSKCKRRSKRK